MAPSADELGRLAWRGFSSYPPQGSDVYVRGLSGGRWRYARVGRFNACALDPRGLAAALGSRGALEWAFEKKTRPAGNPGPGRLL